MSEIMLQEERWGRSVSAVGAAVDQVVTSLEYRLHAPDKKEAFEQHVLALQQLENAIMLLQEQTTALRKAWENLR